MKIDATAEGVGPLTPAAARAEFDADLTYLDTAAVGLPPRRSWMALQQALAQWRAGPPPAGTHDAPAAAPPGPPRMVSRGGGGSPPVPVPDFCHGPAFGLRPASSCGIAQR